MTILLLSFPKVAEVTPSISDTLKRLTNLPVVKSQTLIFGSVELTRYFPSGVKPIKVITFLFPLILLFYSPASKFHNLTVLSESLLSAPPPLARVFPSGLIATERTGLVCPVKVRLRIPFCGSQNLIVLS